MELDETLTQDIYQWNMAHSVKTAGMSLADALNAYTVDRLKVIAKAHHLPNRSKLKKGELVAALTETILDPAQFLTQFFIMGEEEYQFLKDCAHGISFAGEVIAPAIYGYAVELGYLFLISEGDTFAYEMPPEVKALFIETDNADNLKQAAYYHGQWEYINGLANFYGITTFEEVAKFYNEYHETQLSAQDFQQVYALYTKRDQFTVYYHEHLVQITVLDEGNFDELYLAQQDYPRYIPTEEQIINWADELYIDDTPALAALRDYLEDAFGAREDFELDDFIFDVYHYVAAEADFQEVFDLFESYELKFASFAQAEEIVRLLTDVINTTRLWSLNGYTPLEMHNLNGMEIQTPPELEIPHKEPIRVEKIGRNEPCPCGSGKKYKKCCGR